MSNINQTLTGLSLIGLTQPTRILSFVGRPGDDHIAGARLHPGHVEAVHRRPDRLRWRRSRTRQRSGESLVSAVFSISASVEDIAISSRSSV